MISEAGLNLIVDDLNKNTSLKTLDVIKNNIYNNIFRICLYSLEYHRVVSEKTLLVLMVQNC